jgi:hypothetical protein
LFSLKNDQIIDTINDELITTASIDSFLKEFLKQSMTSIKMNSNYEMHDFAKHWF